MDGVGARRQVGAGVTGTGGTGRGRRSFGGEVEAVARGRGIPAAEEGGAFTIGGRRALHRRRPDALALDARSIHFHFAKRSAPGEIRTWIPRSTASTALFRADEMPVIA